MFGISLFSIAYAAISFLLAYLAVHVTLHPPDEGKKVLRKRQFIFLGVLGMAVVVGQEIKGYVDRKHEQEASVLEKRNVSDNQADLIRRTEKIETLLTNQCSNFVQRSSIAQECLDEVRRLRSEFAHSLTQARGMVNQTSGAPVATETAFLRNSMPGIQLPNPFSKLLDFGAGLTNSAPKHYSASLVDTVSVSDGIGASSGREGCVDRNGVAGGMCATAECTEPCFGGSTLTN